MLTPLFQVAGFLGKAFYNRMLRAVGDHASKLAPSMKAYPGDIRAAVCGDLYPKPGVLKHAHGTLIAEELSCIVTDAAKSQMGFVPVTLRLRAIKLDCYLYAQDDKYA